MRSKEHRVCDYYFSLVSPWSYLGHQRFLDLTKKHQVKVDMKLIDVGPMLAASGGLPLAKRSPQRQAYRINELQRWSSFLAIPINTQPAFYPVSPELASRLVLATQIAHGTDTALTLAGRLMSALWAEQKNIADEATLSAIAEELELDGTALLKSAQTASIAEQFQQNTQQSISANVFGVPWYEFEGQPFWGQDRLDFLEREML